MSQRHARTCLYFVLCILLMGCSSVSGTQERHAACRQLKSDIVFNGATSNERRADIQRAEKPLEEKTYDANC